MRKVLVLLFFCATFKIALSQTMTLNEPSFEVAASLYPWDIHDEGIDLMLDNLTEMSGVNSVYLIAVMHKEHRPFNGPGGTGPWHYIHNPAREEWNAEDSRVYFFPHYELYGKIKPYLSENAWLRETDWLKLVIDAARARKLKVGAEVSHTYLPWKEIFKEHPEYQQRDINGNPTGGPCPNNPDIRDYLLALYGDIASNYDVDYIQTCMYVFSGDGLKNGTCFCESCQKKAKEMGFDMKAAIPILRDNPNAQPQLDQWLSFRRASTTNLYKQIIDRMRKNNPDIDFRINDLNNRPTGLYLEDLKDYVTSVHMSTHTEQYGYQNTDRESRIRTVKYFMGDGVAVIPGVPVRILTTPAIVRSSIKVSIDNGSKGIALKHYDGASYSLLRAVRDGLSEAGVSGFKPHTGFEAEEMELSGYVADSCLQEHCVMTTGTGIAKAIFTWPSGKYDIKISYVDEKNGHGKMAVFTGGRLRSSWVLSEDAGCWRRKTIPGINIKKNDEIKITGVADGNEKARIDYIEFIKK